MILTKSILTQTSTIEFTVESPSSISGPYLFSSTNDAAGWGSPDLNIISNSITDTLMMVEDGTTGINSQGNPISQEGCNPLINDLTGKIAVIWRNTCQFGQKILNAQNAGAVAAIIINREPGIMNMAAGDSGANVTIPAVFIELADGLTIVNEMNNGPVVAFIGSRTYNNDLSLTPGNVIRPEAASMPHSLSYDGSENVIQIGALVENIGISDQNANVNAKITYGSTTLYNQSATTFITSGNSHYFTFPSFIPNSYSPGDYNLTYTVDTTGDGYPSNNIISQDFKISGQEIYSNATLDLNNNLVLGPFYRPSNATGSVSVCSPFVDSLASRLQAEGLSFAATASGSSLQGRLISTYVYEWNDQFVDLDDPNANISALSLIDANSFTYPTDSAYQEVYVPFTSTIPLVDNQRYLFCVNTFDTDVYIGFDDIIDYNQNTSSVYKQPVSVVENNGSWYLTGFGSDVTTGVSVKMSQNSSSNIDSIYSNSFSNPSDWIIDHDPIDCSLDWQIGVGLSCTGSYPIANINSTSASDGYAMIDSDAYGGASGGTEIEDSWITMANPINLNGYSDVIVEFETFYRRYNFETPYLVVGIGDGNGNVNWPNLTPSTDISTLSNVFHVFPQWFDGAGSGFSGQQSNNPEHIQIDISSAIQGLTTAELSDIYLRFNWTGTWGYAWFVDDLLVRELPQNEIEAISGWISESSNNFTEYGRTPINQLGNSFEIGGEVYNAGAASQTNVTMLANFNGPTSFSSSSSVSSLDRDSLYQYNNTETLSLQVGQYNGTYSFSSNEDPSGSNNFYFRNFEITNNIYSLDGIGNHPVIENISSTGTSSFSNEADGIMCATGYAISNATNISEVEFLIDTSITVANSEVVVYIVDSSNFVNSNPYNHIYMSNLYTVTNDDINNGFVKIPTCVSLQPGYYYAALELYSYANTYDIAILDDETVPQPVNSSGIFLFNGGFFTSGNAFAIRLTTSSSPNISYSSDIVNACGTYTWIDGNTYTSSNNTATYTIPGGSISGCDSIVTLDLTILSPSTGTDIVNACGTYTWIDGNTYTSSNNTATYTIPGGSISGCDSIVTLDLTVHSPSTGTEIVSSCNSYTWIDGNTYTSSNNTATYTIISGGSNGCDSIVTLDLTILSPSFGIDSHLVCDSLTWIDGNTYTSSNNTASYTIIGGGSNGCDSVVTLDLVVFDYNLDFTESAVLFTSPPFSVQFTNNTPNLSNYNFTWDFGDSTIVQNNGSSVFHEYMYNGLYSVTLKAEDLVNGCGTDSLVKNDLIFCSGGPNVSIEENNSIVNIYPNPTKENITIKIDNFNGNIKTEVYDLIGNRLKITNETTISLRDYARGIYLLKVAYGDRVEEVKVIKQ